LPTTYTNNNNDNEDNDDDDDDDVGDDVGMMGDGGSDDGTGPGATTNTGRPNG